MVEGDTNTMILTKSVVNRAPVINSILCSQQEKQLDDGDHGVMQ